jgi:hypothetical protein
MYRIRYLFIVARYSSMSFIDFVLCSILIYLLFVFCFIVHCSKDKIFNSDPGLYSRYFDPVVHVQQLYLLNKNTIIIYASQ